MIVGQDPLIALETLNHTLNTSTVCAYLCLYSLPTQILLVAAVVDLFIALASGERGWGAFVEPLVILLILVANGACFRSTVFIAVMFVECLCSAARGPVDPGGKWVGAAVRFLPVGVTTDSHAEGAIDESQACPSSHTPFLNLPAQRRWA